jgi:hypothetical protein
VPSHHGMMVTIKQNGRGRHGGERPGSWSATSRTTRSR